MMTQSQREPIDAAPWTNGRTNATVCDVYFLLIATWWHVFLRIQLRPMTTMSKVPSEPVGVDVVVGTMVQPCPKKEQVFFVLHRLMMAIAFGLRGATPSLLVIALAYCTCTAGAAVLNY